MHQCNCGAKFHFSETFIQHKNTDGHWYCETCDDCYLTEQSLMYHMDSDDHWSTYCMPCGRQFMNANCLRMHRNSRTHRGANMTCPFCKAAFTTASGLSHHVESGSCPNARGLNRQNVYEALRSKDQSGIFTEKLLEWHGETWATEGSWNGFGYECYLCHVVYANIGHLNSHLKSPRHQQKLYHCPNRACPRKFVSLAGLFNHLESESCSFMRFEEVQRQASEVITGQKLISWP